ncbi:SRPBCC family protein [Alteriqipengyuania lutimaris]|uniref:SRPBCC family protein n=1 Tax=Alteriqipengyuania lutimaris TaxID=1538146 RepID=A0A395LL35_9SPHN|nr:SRPBCC family protein [Alteriqipengyuania lutimaris]MBB3033539.1 putative membrane protein [Alteriqipengyuania lutimaris]RDS77455.1 SRPBCC family protein [Alteriqipengyuania lutimaris]
MKQTRQIGIAGSVAAAGVALGAAAFGAFLSRRHQGGRDDAPQFARRTNQGEHALVGRSVTIRKPAAELYAYWRDFANLPEFMENVETITKQGGAKGRAVWTIKAPGGTSVDLKTEIAEDVENERIAWRSLDGSDINTKGEVTFTQAPGDRGTRVSLHIEYDAPGGVVGRALAKAFLREPEVQARHDLKRFKMLMETGEIATSAHRKSETREAKQQENA